MRESALAARRDEHGVEVLVVHRPITFSLEQTARAMHAVIDPHLNRLNARPQVGRGRVREVLRRIVTDGWPPNFSPDPARVAYWRQWLLDQAVFTDNAKR
ncbi:MAG: hypothetical protein AB7N73_12335 [Gemmatimonadales bacterium]|jgi:hypothetical protein